MFEVTEERRGAKVVARKPRFDRLRQLVEVIRWGDRQGKKGDQMYPKSVWVMPLACQKWRDVSQILPTHWGWQARTKGCSTQEDWTWGATPYLQLQIISSALGTWQIFDIFDIPRHSSPKSPCGECATMSSSFRTPVISGGSSCAMLSTFPCHEGEGNSIEGGKQSLGRPILTKWILRWKLILKLTFDWFILVSGNPARQKSKVCEQQFGICLFAPKESQGFIRIVCFHSTLLRCNRRVEGEVRGIASWGHNIRVTAWLLTPGYSCVHMHDLLRLFIDSCRFSGFHITASSDNSCLTFVIWS